MKRIKDLKEGDFFMLKSTSKPNENNVWIQDGYNKSTKKWSAYKFSDVNHFTEKKGDFLVFTQFEF